MTRWDEEPEDKFTRNNRHSFPLHYEDGTIDYSVVRKNFLVDIDSESGRHFIIHCDKTDQQKIKMVFDAMVGYDKEFASNYLEILKNVIGLEHAMEQAEFYRKEGVSFEFV